MAGWYDWYLEMPLITRSYATASVVTTAACALELVSPFSLYFNAQLVIYRGQVWRLFTNFFFFGALGLDFFFHMFFLVRYCRLLEEGSFRNRSADFLVMLLFGGALMCCVAPFISVPPFLGSSLAFMMVYVWGRRNEYVRMSFLGLFQFRAPFLPWVLLAFSMMLGNSPVIDLTGIAVGHIYFYLEDVFPNTPAGRGRKVLWTPRLLSLLLDAPRVHETVRITRIDEEPLAPAPQAGGGHELAGNADAGNADAGNADAGNADAGVVNADAGDGGAGRFGADSLGEGSLGPSSQGAGACQPEAACSSDCNDERTREAQAQRGAVAQRAGDGVVRRTAAGSTHVPPEAPQEQ